MTCKYNTVDLSTSTYGAQVEAYGWALTGGVSVDVQGSPQGVAVSQSATVGPRYLTLPLVVIGTTTADLVSKLDALRVLFEPTGGEKALELPGYTDRYWLARVSESPEISWLGDRVARVQVPLVIPDPHAWGSTAKTDTDTWTTDPDTIAVPKTGSAGGCWYAEPVWTLTPANHTQVYVTFESITTSEKMVIIVPTQAAGTDNRIRIDTSRWYADYSVDGGANWINLMTALSETYNQFPRVKAGVSNTIKITGLASGTLAWSYRERF